MSKTEEEIEAAMAEESQQVNLMLLVQQWGLAITREEAQLFLDLTEQVMDATRKLWKTNFQQDQFARKMMLSAYAAHLQIVVGNISMTEELHRQMELL